MVRSKCHQSRISASRDTSTDIEKSEEEEKNELGRRRRRRLRGTGGEVRQRHTPVRFNALWMCENETQATRDEKICITRGRLAEPVCSDVVITIEVPCIAKEKYGFDKMTHVVLVLSK